MRTGVSYKLVLEHEETPYEGDCLASGDDAVDREAEEWIEAQLDSGNEWAWFCAHVVAEIEIGGVTFKGHDYLGRCSYESEASFREPGGYFDDMKQAALEDLERNLRDAIARGIAAKSALVEIQNTYPEAKYYK